MTRISSSFATRIWILVLMLGIAGIQQALAQTKPIAPAEQAATAEKPRPKPTGKESFSFILTEAMAPYTLHVNAVDIPLAHGNWLTARYEWDFGDDTPESRFNQLVGWNAAHVYT